MVWDVFETKPGYDAVAVGQAYDKGLGGEVPPVHPGRSGILALSRAGEYVPAGPEERRRAAGQTSRVLAPLLCSFTESGC